MKSFDISLYGIIDPEHCLDRNYRELVQTAVDNGVTLIQYRDKVNDTRTMIIDVGTIMDALEGTNVPVIVNDRVDVAMATGAVGVHLGQSDMAAEDARRLMGKDAIIGISVKTVEDAETAPVQIVDYAFVGGVHATTSKDNPSAIGVEGWEKRAEILRRERPDLPVGAIAGLTVKNVGEIIDAGADGVAMISALFEAEDVSKACREVRNAIEKARGNE
jgi:thiamine-phosphate pyrophosphorylase